MNLNYSRADRAMRGVAASTQWTPSRNGCSRLGTLALAAAIFGCFATAALPWGSFGHRLITEAAIDDLPDELYGGVNGFQAWRDFLTANSSLADSIKNLDGQEDLRHYIDIDAQLETYPYPFDTVPRDYDAYLLAFGRDEGVLPWEGVAEHYDGLVQAFRARNWQAVYRVSADLSHYVADSVQPLHCTANYNGQLTGNRGIHSRYETTMLSRKVTFADLTTRRSAAPLGGRAQSVADRIAYSFETILDSFDDVAPIMEADTAAKAVDSTYGDAYYDALFDSAGSLTLDRLNDGGRRLADLWYSAWVEAGRPSFDPAPAALPLQSITPTINGNLGEYAATTYFQTNTTDFTDNTNEFDVFLAAKTEDSLALGIGGNLASGSTALLLLDVNSGGSSSLSGTYGQTFLAFPNGLQTAAGITPDYILAIRRTSASAFAVWWANVQTRQAAQLGSGSGAGFALSPSGYFAYSNSNTGGVKDRDNRTISGADAVRTGLEIQIPVSLAGLTPGAEWSIKAIALLTDNSSPPVVSSQSLPGWPLGEFAPSADAMLDAQGLSYMAFTAAQASPTETPTATPTVTSTATPTQSPTATPSPSPTSIIGSRNSWLFY